MRKVRVSAVKNKEHNQIIIKEITLDGGLKAKAMIDCGAEINLVNKKFLKKHKITPKEGNKTYDIIAVNGTSEQSNKQCVMDLHMDGYLFTGKFVVARIEDVDIILGMPWLASNNPHIDWITREVSFPLKIADKRDLDPRNPYRVYASQSHSAKIAEEEGKSKPKIPLDELVPKEYHQFLHVFGKKEAERLPPHRSYDCEIKLMEGKEPKHGPIYPLPPRETQELREYIDEMREKGFIRDSQSPASSPVMFVRKKDGSLRLCVDYRKLNSITVKNRYPLPLTNQLIDRLTEAKYFTKIDLRSGYNLIRIKEGDEWKTAFNCKFGHFEYLVMPFGLTNAPAVFQHMMNDILRDKLDLTLVCYIDDILIFSKTIEEHVKEVSEVLQRLADNTLFAKPEKCEFHKEQVEYLGIWVGKGRLSMDHGKINAIKEWPTPTKVKDIQTFLGFANFYRRFVKNFSMITKPMTALLQKDSKWSWGPEEQASFDKMKEAFMSEPILILPRVEEPFRMEADASNFAYGAILSQKGEDDKWHPVSYFSKTMTKEERNYQIWDKEMLAIIKALGHWRIYLEGSIHQIEILTDHKNLTWFTEPQQLSARQKRWLMFLASYDFVITYVPGRTSKPDALSRRPDHQPKEGGEKDEVFLLPEKVRKVTKTRTVLVSVATLQGRVDEIQAEKEIVADSEIQKAIRTALRDDPTVQDIIAHLEDDAGHLDDDPLDPSAYGQDLKDYDMQGGILYRKDKVYVPDHKLIKKQILELRHDSVLAGHMGRKRTEELIKREYYWPGMTKEIHRYVDSCESCQKAKPKTRTTGLMMPLPIPEAPFSNIGYDLVTGLPLTLRGNDAILTIVCLLTKMALFAATRKKIDTNGIVEILIDRVWSKHGTPLSVVTDRGSIFASEVLQGLYRKLGVKVKLSTAYHPQTDGQAERTNQIGEMFLRHYVNYEQDNWDTLLPYAEFAYNNTKQESIGMTPFFANKGFHPIFTLREGVSVKGTSADKRIEQIKRVQAELKEAMKKAQLKQKEFYDKGKKEEHEYHKGDMVWLDLTNIKLSRPAAKIGYKREGPFEVIEQINPLAYRIRLPDSLKQFHNVFHVRLLSPVHPNTRHSPTPHPIMPGQREYEVEAILSSKVVMNHIEYEVKFVGYEDLEWIHAKDMVGSKELVAEFHKEHPEAPKPRNRSKSKQNNSKKRK